MENIEQLKHIIQNSRNIVFLTGAGVSTPSGLSDFKYLYSKEYLGFAPEDIMESGFLEKHPDIFQKFTQDYFSLDVEPNIIHKMIAEIGNSKNKKVTVITQNIDGLHLKAGSKRVIELHGNIHNWKCNCCKKAVSLKEALASDNLKCNKENCEGLLRPNIVFYGEKFDDQALQIALFSLYTADALIVVGTRLQTQFIYDSVKNFNGKLVFLKRNPLDEPLPRKADLEIYADASKTFGELKKSFEKRENHITNSYSKSISNTYSNFDRSK